MQKVAPVESWKVPAPHSAQLAASASAAYAPALHAVGAAAPAPLYAPAATATQAVPPVSPWKDPAKQSTQLGAPLRAW